MPARRSFVVISAIVLLIAACGGGGGGATTEDMLARIKKDGVIRVATDPNYAPQSFQKSDGTFDGFDVAVANEIAKRLGVTDQVRDARPSASSRPASGPTASTSASAR